jgi:hypothetical protein
MPMYYRNYTIYSVIYTLIIMIYQGAVREPAPTGGGYIPLPPPPLQKVGNL